MAAFAGQWILRGYGSWAVEEKASGRFVGYTGLWYPEGWPEPEIHWGLMQPFHGRGYATEAARRARDFAYRELRWRTAVSCIGPENVASRRVALRLGATLERSIELRGMKAGVYRHPGPSTSNA
jgi:RimJ/RimL family protein N-acetyltransferase